MRTFNQGGVHPPEYKLTADLAIERMPTPARLVILLSQHLGKPAKPIVGKGDKVKKGQLIGAADGFISSNIHAATSGTVHSLEERWPAPTGQYAPAIVIESDGTETWADGLNIDEEKPLELSREEKLKRISDAGIVGMGGAGFPTHVKLNPPKDKTIDTFILNGAECEPFLTPDYRLMLERPAEILKGLEIAASLFSKDTKIYIGIEENKPEAVKAMEKAAQGGPFTVVSLKTKYPQGCEKQLINTITGRTMKEGQLPFDVGALVHNVATMFALYEAVAKKRPLVERVLTLSGMEVKNRKNLIVTVGSLVKDVIEHTGGTTTEINQVIIGGPMMGKAQYTCDVPVTKTTSGILLINNTEIDSLRERPCVRCGKCISACPQGRQPWLLADLGQQRRLGDMPGCGLMDCMECGSCTYVCPARRNIVQWIKYGKAVNAARKR
ncbi:MAG: electron transport complex subunit RsxC [Deltaproteobacteria bacterium]|nr:electron transport complex subunit RsxC [Deltaproteobacteria bacterium]